MQKSSAAGEWRQGWPYPVAGLLGQVISNLHAGTIGVMMKPLGDMFGWSRSEISASILMIVLCQVVLGPIVGALLPRFGMRRLVLVGVIGFAVGLVVVGLSGPNITLWYVGWVICGLSYSNIAGVVWTSGVVHAFRKQRGMALAVCLSGTGVANFFTPLLAVWSMQQFGWRGSFFVIAAMALAILPVVLFLLSQRDDLKRRGLADASAPHVPGPTLREVLANRRFWQIVVSIILVAATMGMMGTHQQAILRDAGVSALAAASYASIAGPALIVGRLVTGYLLDRLNPRYVGAFCFLLPAFTCLIFLNYDGSRLWGLMACGIFGLAFGAEIDIMAYLLSRYFGMRSYPIVYGLSYGGFSLSYGLVPVLAGGVYDLFGSYDKILVVLIAGLVVAAALVALLGKPPVEHGPEEPVAT